jgi:tellurite resistance protein TehA-like permease
MLTSTCRLHLALAVGSALTGTTWGAAMALVVLVVVACRAWARHRLQRLPLPVSGGVLAPAQGAGLLDPAGQRGQAVAGP